MNQFRYMNKWIKLYELINSAIIANKFILSFFMTRRRQQRGKRRQSHVFLFRSCCNSEISDAFSTLFNAFITINVVGFQISYLIPILLRCTVARHNFTPGEYNLGRFGCLIAVISSVWLFITSLIMFFPWYYPVTPENMNYSIVIIAGLALIAITYWMISARHWFVGPKRGDVDLTSLLPFYDTDKTNEETLLLSDRVSHWYWMLTTKMFFYWF